MTKKPGKSNPRRLAHSLQNQHQKRAIPFSSPSPQLPPPISTNFINLLSLFQICCLRIETPFTRIYQSAICRINIFGGMPRANCQAGATIQNVVSFAKMDSEPHDLDLMLIASKIEGCRYNKKRFPAVVIRKTKPRGTVLLFQSGRMIIIGSASENDAEQTAKRLIRDVQKLVSKRLKMVAFHVTNIVAGADLGWRVNMGRLCELRNVIRNENFPGVVYRHMKDVKSALIFASGKVIFTGARSKVDIDNAYLELRKQLEQFRVKQGY